MSRVVVLDDYQRVAASYADWDSIDGEVVFVHDHLEGQELLAALDGADVVVAMRERTAFDAELLGRLGDLRLQCEVGWAISREAIAAAPAGAFTRVVGGCGSSQGAIHAGSVRAVADAAVSVGALTLPVRVTDGGYRYSVPLGYERLPDAARVRFRYR